MTVSFTTSSTASTMSVSFPSRTALNDDGCALSAEKSRGPDRPQNKIAHGTSANTARIRRCHDVHRVLTVRVMVTRWGRMLFRFDSNTRSITHDAEVGNHGKAMRRIEPRHVALR